jgi:hypothetical protein
MGESASHGIERERHTREIGARLGVADFVFSAPPVCKGNALREASGDGLLVVGDRGAVLQVKARDPARAASDSAERASAWTRKHANKARSQGRGAKREIARRWLIGDPLKVSPVRASALAPEMRAKYDLSLAMDVDDWPIVVVLDHPTCGEVDLGFEPDVIWLTFGDWEALQQRLRSTSAFLEYARRVLRAGAHVPLGQEIDRYRALSSADQASAAGVPGCVSFLAPLEGPDKLGADLFHDIINKVWPDDGPIPWNSADQYREIVEFMDRLPPTAQAIAGRWFLEKRRMLDEGTSRASGLIRLGSQDRVVYGCSSEKTWASAEEWNAEFSGLAALRHTQAIETGSPKDTVTLGVAAFVETRCAAHGVSYLFIMLKGVDGQLPMPSDLRRSLERRYGHHNHANGTTSEVKTQ